MKILMVGNVCSSGWYFKKSLEKKGHEVVLVANENKIIDGKPDYPLSWTGWKDISNNKTLTQTS